MSYWTITLEMVGRGAAPICSCGKTKVPMDDHGRFICINCDLCVGAAAEIPQASTEGMTDEKKAKIPPINRLDSTPTAAEQELLNLMLRGPECLDDPNYGRLMQTVEQERQ